MILLKRLYSETDLFDEVEFRPGINIILGKNSGEGTSVNGIGKSTLVRLIDFAFLSKTNRKFFDPRIYDFLENHDFTLEFSIDGELYRIKRYLSNQKTVYFGEPDGELIEYTEEELRGILGNRFFCSDDYEGHADSRWFRTFMRFFVKDDVDHHERSDPINFVHPGVRKSTLLVYNLYLLGLPNKNVYEFDAAQEEVSKLKKVVKGLEKKIEEDTGKKLEEFKLEIFHIEERVRTLRESLKEYKFLDAYKDVENDLIKLTNLISQKLELYNTLRKRLEDYQKSYRFELEVDLEKVKRLYNKANAELAQFVDRTLDEVVLFRKQIVENRKRFLVERERILKRDIDEVLKDISKIEVERSRLYDFLEEREALDSIRNTYEQLIDQKAKMGRSTAVIDSIQSIEKSIAEWQIKISNAISEIINDIERSEDRIMKLRSLFSEILTTAVLVDESMEGAYFDVKTRAHRTSPIDISVSVPKSASLGKSRFKILTYDLTVFLNIVNSQRYLPHFLIHDGVFHSISRKTIIDTLNYVYAQHLRHHDFQYVITANEEELYVSSEQQALLGNYRFDLNEMVIARYEDIPEKMIFRREF